MYIEILKHSHILLAEGGIQGSLSEVLEMTPQQHTGQEGALLLFLTAKLYLLVSQTAQIFNLLFLACNLLHGHNVGNR